MSLNNAETMDRILFMIFRLPRFSDVLVDCELICPLASSASHIISQLLSKIVQLKEMFHSKGTY